MQLHVHRKYIDDVTILDIKIKENQEENNNTCISIDNTALNYKAFIYTATLLIF
jgi:hypothetical protein